MRVWLRALPKCLMDSTGSLLRGAIPSSQHALLKRMLVVLYVLTVLAAWSVAPASAAKADGSPSETAGSFDGSLVVPGVQVLDDGEQERDQHEMERSSPEAVSARAASRTQYEGLDGEQAGKVAREAFPNLVVRPGGGPPGLPGGDMVAGYLSATAASVSLPGPSTVHAVVESTAPMALQTSPGHWSPLDLGLSEAGGHFSPTRADVEVQIAKNLAEGVSLPGVGVSLTPVDAYGVPLSASAGELDGSSVLWETEDAGIEDLSTLVKPTTEGFELSSLLMSEHSPSKLYYRVGMPSGASLKRSSEGSVGVVEEGVTLATIVAPLASDAEGTRVPVTMEVQGNTIAVDVSDASGEYRWPIAVDPTIHDYQFKTETEHGTLLHSPWTFHAGTGQFTAPEHPEGEGWTEHVASTSNREGWGGLFYTTQGESQIRVALAEGGWNDTGAKIENYLVLYAPTYTESYSLLPVDTEELLSKGATSGEVCAPELSCPATTSLGAAANNNSAAYEQEAASSGSGGEGTNTLKSAYVEISQEREPELSFNTASQYLRDEAGQYEPNALYGSNGWLGPHSGAFEVHAKDFGIGISYYLLGSVGWKTEWSPFADGECLGVQCPTEINQKYAYHSGMQEGEDSFEAFVEDDAKLSKDIYPEKIKVDAKPPHSITVSGFSNGDELYAGETHLTFSASDGEGSTPSSGVGSIAISVDGQPVSQQVGAAPATCTPGPCTASGEWVLAARDYATGEHSLVVTATDNAGNVTKEAFSFFVHASSPVAVGPGSVNPSSGEFTLGATDVSIGGGLQVARSYDSRHLTAGVGGPFGPQWNASVGGMESIEELPDGSVVLGSEDGQGTVFAKNKEGKLESPKGDSNLSIEPKESSGKISEYVLSDANAGTVTTFKLPEGYESIPSWEGSFGSEGGGSGQFKHPNGDAVDQTGDVWVTDFEGDRIEEFGPEGGFVRSVGSDGSEDGQFVHPYGIAVSPKTGNVYVTDQGNHRVQEFNSEGAFVTAFGREGSGPGEFGVLAGVTVDTLGNVWVSDYGNNRVEEFSANGEYERSFGSEGTGNGQFKGPLNVAVSGEDLYVTDYGNNRVEEFTQTGSYVAKFGSYGSGNGQFNGPHGIAADPTTGDLYVSDSGNSRVEEFSASGAYIAKFGIEGTGEGDFKSPIAITDAFGDLYVVDWSNERIDKWSIPYGSGPWEPYESKGPVPSDTMTYRFQVAEVEGQQVIQPKIEVAPAPAGVSCPAELSKLNPGCHALSFTYATSTKVEGEKETEWGEYDGRLMVVSLTAYNPSEKGMKTKEVAKYAYDKQGRLRAEWDPRVAPKPLKTIYGYDSYGHVTAISSAGEEPWLLAYGATAGETETGTGRLLAVGRPNAATGLGGSTPVNTASPTLSTSSPEIGVKLSATTGTWSNSPQIYAYQWYECSASGGDCEPIGGATNPTYTPPTSLAIHQLFVEVTATNAGGSGMVRTAFTNTIPARAVPTYRSGGKRLGSVIKVKYSSSGSLYLYLDHLHLAECRSGSGAGQIESGGSGSANLNLSGCRSLLGGCTMEAVEKHGVEFKFGTRMVYGPEEEILSSPQMPILFSPNERLILAISGSVCPIKGEYAFPPGGGLTGNISSPTEEKSTRELKFETTLLNYQFNGVEYSATGLVSESGHHVLYLSGTWSTSTEGGASFSEETGERFTGTAETPTAPKLGSTSIATLEYNVPLSGSGLPTMTEGEVKKWAQKDYPVEAMAVFPPDSPQSWPASSYTRAMIHYIDGQGRAVNTATPGGGIATSEYNEFNDVVRALSVDNRAKAMKEGAKSAEVAERLGTVSKYTSNGTELVETTGPEHEVRMTNKEVKEARDHVAYYYDEGAPEGETYNLLTRTVNSVLVGGKEEERRTARTYYSGQKNLGWKLRKPTSVVTDPAGLDLTSTTVYNETTGAVVEAKSPGGSVETVYPPSYAGSFGTEGSGTGQLKKPEGIAIDSSGDKWVVDTGNDRIEKFGPTGAFLASYGSAGSGHGQFSSPFTIAINQKSGNVYVSDYGNNRIEELSESGAFIRVFGEAGSGNGQLKNPTGLTIDAKGEVLVCDLNNHRVEVFSETGEYLRQFGSGGTGEGKLEEPGGIVIDEGEVFVSDFGNDRISEFTLTGTFIGQFGVKGKEKAQLEGPIGLAVNPSNNDLFIADYWNHRIDEWTPAGKLLTEFGVWGASGEAFRRPAGVAIASNGELFVVDEENDDVTEWSPPGAGGSHLSAASQFGSKGSGSGQFNVPYGTAISGAGDLLATDVYNSRVEVFSPNGTFMAAYGSYGSGNGQFKIPLGIAVNQSTEDMYVVDYGNDRIDEMSTTGAFIRSFGKEGSEPGDLMDPEGVTIDSSGNVLVADAGNDRIDKFSSSGTFIASYGTKGSGNGQFDEPSGLVVSGSDLYVADAGNNRIEVLSASTGSYVSQFGGAGEGSGKFATPQSIAVDAAGNLYVADRYHDRVQEFSQSGTFLAAFGSSGGGEGEMDEPLDVAISAAGVMYVSDDGNDRIDVWTPADQGAHDTKMFYYTAKGEAETEACQNHPEWAGLICATAPVAQPEDGLPKLPVTTTTYNMWGEPEVTTETFGTVVRTKTVKYDSAGRMISSEETSTKDEPLPEVTDHYSETTGALVKRSLLIKGEEKDSVISTFNTLGNLTSYTDPAGTTDYEYEGEGSYKGEKEVDGRVRHVDDGKGTQTYTYNETTGTLKELADSAAKTFTASYDVEGKMVSETYPNGMTASYTYSPLGEATALAYEKTSYCTEHCIWFSDSELPGPHGETMSEESTLAKESYAYDADGRLTQVQEEPTGKGCVTRLYSYDEESDRTSQTMREPGTGGVCANEGGTTQTHKYDPADRLTDEGVGYDVFGNMTTVPASDAGGHELKSSFYVNGQVQSQTQNEQTNSYELDPEGRVMQVVASGKEASGTMIDHYSGPGEAISWTSKVGTGEWTRNIAGIDGTLSAVQTNGGTPVLDLHDLRGDVVATASESETATKLSSTYQSTEFGVPTTSSPPKFSWLGSSGVTSELPTTGIVTTGAGSYVPEIGRPIQTEPAVPIAFPDGESKMPGSLQVANIGELSNQMKGVAAQDEAEQQDAARKQAEEQAKLNECPASACGPWPEEGGAVKAVWTGETEVENKNAIASGVKVFSKSFDLSPTAAIALGDAMIFFGTSFEQGTSAYGVPTWAFRILESMSTESLDEYGTDLVEAGTTTQTANVVTGIYHPVKVTINGHASRRGVLWWLDIEGWILTPGYDPDA
jgi:tripartite motif-containing protein 71